MLAVSGVLFRRAGKGTKHRWTISRLRPFAIPYASCARPIGLLHLEGVDIPAQLLSLIGRWSSVVSRPIHGGGMV
jgi:hypothetical protein